MNELKEYRKKETLKKEFFKQLEEETRATEEDNGYDKRKIPDITPDEEDRFENDRQGGKSIFDDGDELDDNQY